MEQVTLIISTVKSLVPQVSGFLSNRDFEAGLVVRARVAKVSMMARTWSRGMTSICSCGSTSARVTASKRPSGTATTTSVTEMMSMRVKAMPFSLAVL